jgi:hypothetical protein
MHGLLETLAKESSEMKSATPTPGIERLISPRPSFLFI